MSDLTSAGTEKTGKPKAPISPARNIIGLIILIGVTIVGVIEYSAYFGHKWAVNALNTRMADDEKELMTVQEAETLLGKQADGPAVEFKLDVWSYDEKTYTWRGLLKQHTVTAYYTKGKDSRLHHFESDGSKFETPPVRQVESPPRKKSSGKGSSGKTGNGKTESQPKPKTAPESKDTPSEPSAKAGTAAKPDPAADSATKGKTPEPSGKGDTPK